MTLSPGLRRKLRVAQPYLLLAPLAVLLICGVLIPMAVFTLYGFWQKEGQSVVEALTFDNFIALYERPVYLWLIGKAALYGAVVALVTLVLAYPLAYLVATRTANTKGLVLLAVLVPLYTSDIVRIFAWRSVLGSSGLVNQSLLALGVIDEPISGLLFTPFAALVSLSHMLFPFMFLAVWAALENLKPSLTEAARDLGARPLRVFRRVIFPLSLPGVLAGVFFVFVPVTGDYLYISMMGGPEGVTITKAIVQQFGAANNWPFGSAMATATMLFILLVLMTLGLLVSRIPALRMYRHG